MSPTLQQQYAYLNWRRRVAELYRHQLLVAKQNAINNIHSYIVAGNDPRLDPELSANYYALVDEYGESLFQAEMMSYLGDAALIREEDEDPKVNN